MQMGSGSMGFKMQALSSMCNSKLSTHASQDSLSDFFGFLVMAHNSSGQITVQK